IFELVTERVERLAGLNVRWHNNGRFGPSQEPDKSGGEGQEKDAAENDQNAVLFPEGGRELGTRRTEGRDLVGEIGVRGSGWTEKSQTPNSKSQKNCKSQCPSGPQTAPRCRVAPPQRGCNIESAIPAHP